MAKIGHVDLGSTHPDRFIDMERKLGHIPVGIYDDFRVNGEKHLKDFAKEKQLKIYTSLEEMANEVDVVFIHSVNWDIHYDKMLPFIKKNKGIYIDKPICGSMNDITKISKLSKNGARISGGSMVIYSDEIIGLHQNESNFIDDINVVLAGGPNDKFYYGIHIFYMVCSVLGYDIKSARYIGENVQKLYELTWVNGKKAVLSIGDTGTFFPFHMTLISSEQTKQYKIKGFLALENMLQRVIPYLTGQSDEMTGIVDLLNCERAALAAFQSEKNGGMDVLLSTLNSNIKHPGYEFEKEYKIQNRK